MEARPRICEQCSQPRLRLDEHADDQHLEPGQKAEERFESVDYDVWFCVLCEDAVVIPYGRWFSGKTRCAKCGYKTARSNSVTLRSATYDHGGIVEVTETCHHCQHVHSFRRYTPRLTRSASSSSSSRSSFGGGSSSGRGSSGSW